VSSQVVVLLKNIDDIVKKVEGIKSKTFLSPPVPKINITPFLMTKRQIAKRRILLAGGIINAAGATVQITNFAVNNTINSSAAMGADTSNAVNPLDNYDVQFAANASRMIAQQITPEVAHFIVYGKFMRDEAGNLVDNEVLYPDCVLRELSMPDEHPTLSDIQLMINKVVKVIGKININLANMIDDIAQSMIAIPACITSIASAAAILPPGAGIPTAFAAFQGLMANIMNIVSKIGGVTEDIEILNNIPILVNPQKLDAILGLINGYLITINTTLDVIDGLTKIIPSVPTPPGVGNEPGEPIQVEASASPDTYNKYETVNVTLSAKATKGSWEYKYRWETSNGKLVGTSKDVSFIGPNSSTKYKVTVTDKKDSANSAIATVLINVSE
jgi:hypothetical protein